MFRLNRWAEPREFVPNPFAKLDLPLQQDIKQVWFAGVHADIGGGYPEAQSALSKFPLGWMIGEARAAGLRVDTGMCNHLVLGHERKGSTRVYVAPDPNGCLHDSMTVGWQMLELFPKRVKWREWPDARSVAGWYLPKAEPRLIPEGARIHWSVLARKKVNTRYRPPNLPMKFSIEATEDGNLSSS